MIIFAAIRNVDGEELPSKQSARPFRVDVTEYCDWVRKTTPEWDKKHPVVRIARFICEEI